MAGQHELRRLRRRAEFLNAAKGRRAARTAFSLQATSVPTAGAGVGLTVTKKVGNAPERNRIRRRLRAALKACSGSLLPQHDYVLVGRREALTQPFAEVVSDLASAIARVHAAPRPPQT
ncbi:MAG TPA: ribonuclease P protein component [Devosia sp.]|nr:ribonuclease P protein component [Devosia sp.]